MRTTTAALIVSLLFAFSLAGCSGTGMNLGGEAARMQLNSNPEPNSLYLEIEPDDMSAKLGDNVQLHLYFHEMSSPVYSVAFDINYDEEYLEYVSFEEGTFLKGNGIQTFLIAPVDNPSQGILANAALSRLGQVDGAQGTGIVATITFKLKKYGYADVFLENVMALSSQNQVLSFEVLDGKVYISDCLADGDLDGYGLGCDLGSDCNDDDFYINPGQDELCDGTDNNCNGQIDEDCECVDGQSRYCGTNVGVCEFGTQQCEGGTWGVCAGGIESSPNRMETCNGLDDDCDGQVDEGLQKACGETFIGACGVGSATCQSGEWIGCPAPVDEICGDATDNDCDGQIDEDCSCQNGATQLCGDTTDVGICTRGVQTCYNNAWSACEGVTYPAPETCNGLDDDCDGTIDDGLTIACSANHQGICAQGIQSCVNGDWTGCPSPTTEICDNDIDEDCDGLDDVCEGTTDLAWNLCLDTYYADWGNDACSMTNCPDGYLLINCQQNGQSQLREVCIKFTKTSCSEDPICTMGVEISSRSCQESPVVCTSEEVTKAEEEVQRTGQVYLDAKDAFIKNPEDPALEAAYWSAKDDYLKATNYYNDIKQSCYNVHDLVQKSFDNRFLR